MHTGDTTPRGDGLVSETVVQASPLCPWNSTLQVRAHHLRRQVIIASLDLPDGIIRCPSFTLEGISCFAIDRRSAVVVSLSHKVCTIVKERSIGRIREYSKQGSI